MTKFIDKLEYTRLDVVAECMDVSDHLYKKCWSLMVDEPFCEEPDGQQMSPNRIVLHESEFTEAEIEEINSAA